MTARKPPLAAAALAGAIETQLKPARLDVDAPWELPAHSKQTIATAIAGEAWLQRMGLLGLLTGIAHSNMKQFDDAVERLVGQLRYAREVGRAEGREQVEHDVERRYTRRVGYAALAGLAAGALFGIALASFLL